MTHIWPKPVFSDLTALPNYATITHSYGAYGQQELNLVALRDINGLWRPVDIGNMTSRIKEEMDLLVFWESSDLYQYRPEHNLNPLP